MEYERPRKLDEPGTEQVHTADEGLQKELADLDGRISGEQPEVTEAAPKENTNLVEQDGELLLSVDTDVEEPIIDDPDIGQSSDQDNLSSSEEAEQEEAINQEPDAYNGKSREELIDMLSNAQSKIGEQGNELGQLRKVAESSENLTDEEVFEKLTAKDVKVGLAEERSKLDNIDPYDAEAISKQREVIQQLETDLITKTTEESINARYNQQDNEVFEKKQKQAFADEGVMLEGSEFDDVTKLAYNYAENGRLTGNAYQKAMLDIYGVDQMQKHYSMVGEAKARQDIKTATDKTVEKVDVRGSGKASKLVNINKMSGRELNKALDNLSIEDLRKLNQRYNTK
tara:strand:+ start:368 stop:1393 length:1026 start_codon:yes stop_codon:yes gene_type:complete